MKIFSKNRYILWMLLTASVPAAEQQHHQHDQQQPLCWNDTYSTGKWVVDKGREKKEYVCCDHHEYNEVSSTCPLSQKPQVLFSPYVAEDALLRPKPHGCSCEHDDRTVLSDRERYLWEPSNCTLLPWNPAQFCELLGERRMLLVGDSITTQIHSALVKMLNEDNKTSCSDQIHSGATTHLTFTYTSAGARGSRQGLYEYFEMNPADIVILNIGLHLQDAGDMWDILNHAEPLLQEMESNQNTTLVFVTIPGGHLGCLSATKPLEFSEWIPPPEVAIPPYYGTWTSMPEKMRCGRDYFKKMKHRPVIELEKILSYRPDAHVLGTDCVHYCAPGPLDMFPIILLNKLFMKEI